MRRPRLEEIFERLVAEGLANADQRPGLAAAVERSTDAATPWFVRALVGLGAWVAAILLLVFMALLEILNEHTYLLIGPVLCGGAVLLRGSRSQAARINDFLEQLYLALCLAGQGVTVYGLYELLDNEFSAALGTLVLEVALVVLYTGAFGRFLSVNFAWIALAVVVGDAPEPLAADLPVDLTVTLAALALAWVWWQQPRLLAGPAANLVTPIGYGTATFLLGLLLISISFDSPAGWPATAVLTIVVALLSWRIQGKVSPLTAAILLLGAITWTTPGLMAAVLVMTLGFYRRDPPLLGLALAFLVVFTSAYYYHLDMTLLRKSGVLAASGLLLLLVRARLVEAS
ncbi:MAG: DUF4401 domain-containing protein [Armatimonadetes bacterium]|nr:DUF4401 domain-containing protein [Armatimonadota bacterium]